MAALAFAPLASTAQEAPTWSQFQGGPGHPGVLVDGPQPPYRVRWTLPAPAGEALSGAVVAADLAVSVGAEAIYGIDVASGSVDGKVFVYRAPVASKSLAAKAVQHIIDRFCAGSVEQFLIGLVDEKVLPVREIERLARKVKRKP
jgi:hypothetical protein